MNAIHFQMSQTTVKVDLSGPIDISIGIRKEANVNAFFLPNPEFETAQAENFTADVNQGGSCNVENISLSPHGNGTHTECIGHISEEHHTLSACLQQFHFLAALISVPIKIYNGGDQIVDEKQLANKLKDINPETEALVIRTLPNKPDKQHLSYSGTQPPYLTEDAIELVNEYQIQHLLLDLPSLDHENDPTLKAHHAFFQYPQAPQLQKTVTEFVYIPPEISDDAYLLNLQTINLESDASPSRPCLYTLESDNQF